MEWIGKPEPHRSLQEDMGSPFYDGMTQQRSSGSGVHQIGRRHLAPGTGEEGSQPLLQLRQGEMVQHKAFGRGMVLSVQPMGNDALLEIAFDGPGTKKLMLRSASAHMKKI